MEEEIDLNEIFISLWAKKKIIIVTTIIFTLIGFLTFIIINNFTKEEALEENQNLYYAQTTFIVSTSQTATTQVESALENSSIPFNITENSRAVIDESIIKTYSEIIKSQSNLTNIIQKLNLSTDTNTLYNSISVSRVLNTNLTRIIVAYPDKNQAIQIADELMNEFYNNMIKLYSIDQVSIIDKAYILSDIDIANIFKNYILYYHADAEALEAILAKLDFNNILPHDYLVSLFEKYIFTDTNIIDLDIESTLANIIKLEESKSISAIKYTVIGALAGIVASVAYIFIIEIFDTTIKNENYINTKKLAILDSKTDKNNFDTLKVKLEQNKSILITSDENNDSTTLVANKLATVLANSKKKTLLLDLTSGESTLLSKTNPKSFCDYINNNAKDFDKYVAKSNIQNLDVLLQENINNVYIDDNKLENSISSLEGHYDYIIISSNNVLENPITLELSKLVKNTILVATQRKTKVAQYTQAQETITEIDGNVIGTILVK